jgi:hypothetical protein
MKAIKYQIIKVAVPAAGASVSINTSSDKLYKRITGILVTMPYMVPFMNMSTLSLQINDREIFPDDFEAKLISFDSTVATNERFYQLDEPADGSTIKGRYTDISNSFVDFPYTLHIYLRLEDKNV